MSYYCSYLLNWDPESPTMWEVAQALALGAAETSAEDLAKASNDPGWLEMLTHRWEDTLNGSETSGWGECQTDLLMVSRLWPECLFALYVTGDSDDDRCVEYYKNGQTHQGPATVTYAPFDPDKLHTKTHSFRFGPEKEPPPTVFLHRGVLVRQSEAGYRLAPLSEEAKQAFGENLLLEDTGTYKVRGHIDDALDHPPAFQLTSQKVEEEARAQVLHTLRELKKTFFLGRAHPGIAQHPKSVDAVGEAIERWVERVESGQTAPPRPD